MFPTTLPPSNPPISTSECDNPNNNLHTLSCTHTIIPLPHCLNPPFPTIKSLCSPNCTPLIYSQKASLPRTFIKNTSLSPFICPVCIEAHIRTSYASELARQTQAGGLVTRDAETNVMLWTYGEVFKRMGEGGRLCEGTKGVLRGKYVEGFRVLLSRGRWEGAGKGEGKKGVSKTTAEDDVEIDKLAEMLMDARIGLKEEDADLDGITAGIQALSSQDNAKPQEIKDWYDDLL